MLLLFPRLFATNSIRDLYIYIYDNENFESYRAKHVIINADDR